MNALRAKDSKLFLRLRRRFFQRESGAESEGKDAICGVNAGDPSQMYPWREIAVKTATRLDRIFVRIDSRGRQRCERSYQQCELSSRGVNTVLTTVHRVHSCEAPLVDQHHLPRGHEVTGVEAVGRCILFGAVQLSPKPSTLQEDGTAARASIFHSIIALCFIVVVSPA